jgi:phosphatidylserine decarboxylase
MGGPSRPSQQSYFSRLKYAYQKTRVQWYAIPAIAGIAFLGVAHFYRIAKQEKARQEEELAKYASQSEGEQPGKPKKRKRIRPSGPW